MINNIPAISCDVIKPDTSRLTLSEATIDEVERIRRFILDAKDPNLVIHPIEAQRDAALRGLLFKVEDAGLNLVATSQIVAVKSTPYHEMGNCYVVEPYRRHGIQRVLILARAAAFTSMNGPQGVLIVGVDPCKSADSHRNIVKMGFRPLVPFPREFLKVCSGCKKRKGLEPGRICCCDFYYLPPDSHHRLVEEFLRLGEQIPLRGHNGNSFVLENLSINAREERRRKALEHFVKGYAEAIA